MQLDRDTTVTEWMPLTQARKHLLQVTQPQQGGLAVSYTAFNQCSWEKIQHNKTSTDLVSHMFIFQPWCIFTCQSRPHQSRDMHLPCRKLKQMDLCEVLWDNSNCKMYCINNIELNLIKTTLHIREFLQQDAGWYKALSAPRETATMEKQPACNPWENIFICSFRSQMTSGYS